MSYSCEKFGKLSSDAFPRNGFLNKTIGFVEESLLPWRNDFERTSEDSEERLNAQLQIFLQCRANVVFPVLIFQHEQRQSGRRRVDIGVHCAGTGKYEAFLLIEGKRLPAPSKNREREYVTGENGEISGGIQRFKLGLHGMEHEAAIIVGYVQKNSPKDWYPIINGWISDLAETQANAWSVDEKLTHFQNEDSALLGKSVSDHPRVNGCKTPNIHIHHFWIQM